jgi:Molybdopterin-binding domain of aldehyde dehydrogenase
MRRIAGDSLRSFGWVFFPVADCLFIRNGNHQFFVHFGRPGEPTAKASGAARFRLRMQCDTGKFERIEKQKLNHFADKSHARNTHSAVSEARVEEQLGVIRVTRVVSAEAAGRISNTKTGRSQIIGVGGMGIGAVVTPSSAACSALSIGRNSPQLASSALSSKGMPSDVDEPVRYLSESC